MEVEFATSKISQEIAQHAELMFLTRRYLIATKRRLKAFGKYVFPESDKADVLMTVGKIEGWLQKGYYIPDSMYELQMSFVDKGDGNEEKHYRNLVRFGIMHPDRKDVQKVLTKARQCLTKMRA